MAEISNDLIYEILKNLQAGMARLERETAGVKNDISDLKANQEETNFKIGNLAQGQVGMRNDLTRLIEVTKDIAMTTDHHTHRLDKIEQRLGLDTLAH